MRYTPVGRPESQRRDLVIVAVLAIAAWVLAGLSFEQRLVVTRGLRSSVLLPFLTAHAAFAEQRSLAERVVNLRSERDRLSRRVLEAADLRAENERLRRLLELSGRVPGDFLVAELVPGQPVIGDSHTFMIAAKGIAAVEVPVGIGNAEGLVGVVRSVRGGNGFGEFWTHPDFRVSVRAETGNTSGIVRAEALPTGETLMLLDGVPYQTEIAPGTALVTAGLGGVYPAGIRVGTILSEAESKSGWSRSYLVLPAVRPETVSFVLVWQRPGSTAVESEREGSGER